MLGGNLFSGAVDFTRGSLSNRVGFTGASVFDSQTITGISPTFTAAFTSGLTIFDAEGIVIPPNTTITSVSSTSIQISNPALSSSGSIRLYVDLGDGDYLLQDAILIDPNNNVTVNDIPNYTIGVSTISPFGIFAQSQKSVNDTILNGIFNKYIVTKVTSRTLSESKFSAVISWGEEGTESEAGVTIETAITFLPIFELSPNHLLAPIIDPRVYPFNSLPGGSVVAPYNTSIREFFDLLGPGGSGGSGGTGSGEIIVSGPDEILRPVGQLDFRGDFVGSFEVIGNRAVIGITGDSSLLPLGPPPDDSWIDGGFFTDWTSSTLTNEALDQISQTIAKLAPPQPPSITSRSLALTGTYSAPLFGGSLKAASNGNTVSNGLVSSSSSSDITLSNTSTSGGTASGGFGVVAERWITGLMDGASVGSVYIPNSTVDPGTTINNNLEVTEYDYWQGSPGRENFWPALQTKINNPFALPGTSFGVHTFRFQYFTAQSGGGTPGAGSSILSAYYDNPAIPNFQSLSLTTDNFGNLYISGVPSLSNSSNLFVGLTAGNIVSQVYPSPFARITSAITTTGLVNANGAQSNPITGSSAFIILNNSYTEDISLTVSIINAASTQTTQALTIASTRPGRVMRIDTVSNESTRLISGATSGNFPSQGSYGSAYDSSQSLVGQSGYLYELQLLNGKFQRLSGINYSLNYPIAGPNYASDSNSGYRWVIFKRTSVSQISSFVMIFTGGENFTGDNDSKVTSGISMYARVDGATPSVSTLWVNCNSPYSPGNNPGSGSSQGDPAMDSSNSTFIQKAITFGTASKSGDLFVRVGLPIGSSIKFSGLTIT